MSLVAMLIVKAGSLWSGGSVAGGGGQVKLFELSLVSFSFSLFE